MPDDVIESILAGQYFPSSRELRQLASELKAHRLAEYSRQSIVSAVLIYESKDAPWHPHRSARS
jgi:ribosomal protein L16 Arg81 hydroxylase